MPLECFVIALKSALGDIEQWTATDHHYMRELLHASQMTMYSLLHDEVTDELSLYGSANVLFKRLLSTLSTPNTATSTYGRVWRFTQLLRSVITTSTQLSLFDALSFDVQVKVLRSAFTLR